MMGGMKVSAVISRIGVLLLSGCSLFGPQSTFQIASADRPVKSASLKLCQQTFSLANTDGGWRTTIHVPGDCDGGISAVMSDGSSVFCPVGYVTSDLGSNWFFAIKGDDCRPSVTFGDARSGNSS